MFLTKHKPRRTYTEAVSKSIRYKLEPHKEVVFRPKDNEWYIVIGIQSSFTRINLSVESVRAIFKTSKVFGFSIFGFNQ